MKSRGLTSKQIMAACTGGRDISDSDSSYEPEDGSADIESGNSTSPQRAKQRGRGRGKGVRARGRGKSRGGRGRRGSSDGELEEAARGQEEIGQRGRGQRGRGQRGRGQRGRGQKGRGSSVGEPAAAARGQEERGQRGRGQRGRGQRGRGRGRLAASDQNRVQTIQQQRQERLRKHVDDMDERQVRELLTQVLNRQPSLIFDLTEITPPQPLPPQPAGSPDWCVCGNCRDMPTDEEKLCCNCQPQNCVSKREEMDVVLDPMVLELANRYRGEFFGLNHDADNKALRHGCYRQFTLWRHGRLGRGVRRVIPSCCVIRIRDRYPDPQAHYTGFSANRLA